MTRHGAGPMEEECAKADINASIVDATNMPNDWQGSLRFGFLKTDSLYRRIAGDFSRYENATANMVFTQLNYTNGKLATGIDTFEEIQTPDFITNTFLSDQKDIIVRA
jgi:adenylosuccinate synthase